MINVALTTAEFAWLLASLRAESAIGVDAELLFPDKPAVQNKLYAEGLESLRERDLIVPGKQPGRENIETELALWVDLVANPRLAVVTERRDDGRRQRVTQYIDDHNIIEYVDRGEAAPEGRRHHLHRVQDVPTMVLRVLEMTSVPETNPLAGATAEMNDAVFKKVKELVDAGQAPKAAPALKKLGLSDEATASVVEALKDPERAGTITIFELDGNRIIDARALAYFASDDAAWIVEKPSMEAPALHLTGVSRRELFEKLGKDLKELIDTTPQP